MSVSTEVMFLHAHSQECPYIYEFINYTCDGIEGSIKFEGYYNVNNEGDDNPKYKENLPQTMKIFIRKLQPIISPAITYNVRPQQYKTIEEHLYTVVIYKLETHTNFKYLNRHTLYFRILDKY